MQNWPITRWMLLLAVFLSGILVWVIALLLLMEVTAQAIAVTRFTMDLSQMFP